MSRNILNKNTSINDIINNTKYLSASLIAKRIAIFIVVISTVLMYGQFLPEAAVSAATEVPERQRLNLNIISPYNIKLEWMDNINYEKGFVIQRSEDSGSFKTIVAVPANTTSYNDFSVSPGHVYTYKVLYIDYHGNSRQYTSEASTSSDMISRPDSLEIVPSSPTQIELKWTYPGYKQYDTIVERKSGKDGKWELIYHAPIGVFKYIDKELTAGVKYYYRLKAATDSNIYSAYYPSVYGETIYTSLEAPQDIYGYAVSQTKIYLTWKYDKEKEIDYFEVERKTEDEDSEYVKVAISPFTNKWFQDSGLTTGKLYTYRIRAKKGGSYSEYSEEITINCGYINPPVALSARASSNNSIELEWENRGLDIGAEVELWRKSDIYDQWELYTVMDRNYNKFIDNNVEEGVNYSYRLRSVVSYNRVYSNYSNIVSAYPLDYNAPSDIDYIVIDKNKIQLMWKYDSNIYNYENNSNIDNSGSIDNSSKFKAGYIVEMKEGIYGKWKELAEISLTAKNYFATGLDEDKTYYFRVKVFNDNGSGIGVYSKEIKVTTHIPEKPEITSIQALSPSKIKLTWKSDILDSTKNYVENIFKDTSINNSDIVEGFIIERKLKVQNYYKVIAILPSGSNSYVDSGLSPSKRYSYRIKAFNKAGSSEYSKEMFAVTNPISYFYDIPSSHPAKEAINDLAGRGVFDDKGTEMHEGQMVQMFYPDEPISKAEFVCTLIRAFKLSAKQVGSFADVTYGSWCYEEIMIAKNLGIITGDMDNYFYPDRPITNEEMKDMINKALKAQGKAVLYNIGRDYEDNDLIMDMSKEITRGEVAIEIYKIMD